MPYTIKICGVNLEPVITKDCFGTKKHKKHEHTPILIYKREEIDEDRKLYLSVLSDKYYRWAYIYRENCNVPIEYFSDSTTKQK